MADDLLFDRNLYPSFGDIFVQTYYKYLRWSGRSVLQTLLEIACLMPKSLFSVINSMMFIMLSLLIYANIIGRKSCDWLLFITIQLFLWITSVDFAQTILWREGACNYLWGMVIILGFLTLFRYLLEHVSIIKPIQLIGLGILGFLAGWGNENTSGGAILIALLYLLY